MQFRTSHPISRSMAAAITEAVHEYDAGALVRAEVSSQQITISGELSVAQARAALLKAHCDPAELQEAAGEAIHVQGGHTCCGHCT
ncbi:MAG TPA: hypothetical protein PKC03_12835 [Dokdonella sp.]|jgi:hypothetical protein|nr:hypothetical protein [Dokdonella sp.]